MLFASPRKRRVRVRTKAKDIIELPKPYNIISSDDIKRWDREIRESGAIDEEAEINAIVPQMAFTNALVLKMNQLTKQVVFNVVENERSL